MYTHSGPPASLKKHVEEFIFKWERDPRTVKKPYEKQGRLYVEIKRDYIDIKLLIEDNLRTLSLGKHLDEMVKKGYRILDESDLLIADLRGFWTTYLDGKKPWER